KKRAVIIAGNPFLFIGAATAASAAIVISSSKTAQGQIDRQALGHHWPNMRVFLYEFVTGGGWWHYAGPPPGSLLAEGAAMVQAMAADLAEFADIVLMRDVRFSPDLQLGCELVPVESASDELSILNREAARADWTMLIAPETGGALLQRSRMVESIGG